MKRLVLTVGPPRAGKTTWSQAQGVPIVNPDSVRLALHGRAFFPQAEAMVWAIVGVMVRSLFAAGH
jgi:predicted kinase